MQATIHQPMLGNRRISHAYSNGRTGKVLSGSPHQEVIIGNIYWTEVDFISLWFSL